MMKRDPVQLVSENNLESDATAEGVKNNEAHRQNAKFSAAHCRDDVLVRSRCRFARTHGEEMQSDQCHHQHRNLHEGRNRATTF